MAGFGVLDLYSFYRAFPPLVRIFENYVAGIVPALTVLMIVSLLASGPLFIIDNRVGYVIYYFQFPFRLLFFILTFGFILRVFPTQQGTFAHGMEIASVFGLEAVRLMLTIQKNKASIS
jgi:hypothetical protein